MIPSQSLAIHEKPHQLRNDESRVGVVQLHEDLVRKTLPCVAVRLETPQNVLDRARNEEVLLLETQFLACRDCVVWIKDLGQVLGEHLVRDRLNIFAAVEVIQIELLG